jgi:hypothetical protein
MVLEYVPWYKYVRSTYTCVYVRTYVHVYRTYYVPYHIMVPWYHFWYVRTYVRTTYTKWYHWYDVMTQLSDWKRAHVVVVFEITLHHHA